MNEVFVVSDGCGAFLDWDDRGPMSTGYPIWVPLERARKFTTMPLAYKSGEAAKRCEKIPVWVQRVSLVLEEEAVPVILAEDDPEWADYQRLKEKFKGRV